MNIKRSWDQDIKEMVKDMEKMKLTINEKKFRMQGLAREIVRDPTIWLKLEEKSISIKDFVKFPWDYQRELKEIAAEVKAELEREEELIKEAMVKLGINSYDVDE